MLHAKFLLSFGAAKPIAQHYATPPLACVLPVFIFAGLLPKDGACRRWAGPTQTIMRCRMQNRRLHIAGFSQPRWKLLDLHQGRSDGYRASSELEVTKNGWRYICIFFCYLFGIITDWVNRWKEIHYFKRLLLGDLCSCVNIYEIVGSFPSGWSQCLKKS